MYIATNINVIGINNAPILLEWEVYVNVIKYPDGDIY